MISSIVTFWQSKHDVRGEDGIPTKIREPGGTSGFSSRNGGESVKEVPEGGTVGDGVTDSTTDENAVSEFGDLKGHDRGRMSSVANFVVEREEVLDGWMNIGRRQEVGDGDMSGGGVDEIDASVVACDVDVAVNISFEATCKGREKGECVG